MDLYVIRIYNTDTMLSYCIDVQKTIASIDTSKFDHTVPLLQCTVGHTILNRMFCANEVNQLAFPDPKYRIVEQYTYHQTVNIVGIELFLLVTNSFVDEAIEASKVFIHSMHTEILQRITSGRAYYPPEIFVIRSQ